VAVRVRHQTARKKLDGKCFFCPETDVALLDCHRIVPGEQGGRYQWANTLTLCANCHRKVHAGTIVVVARRQSTGGTYIQCRIDGEDKFIKETK